MSSVKTFKIVLCELFHPFVFGVDENSDKNINGHFIVINTYTKDSLLEDEEGDVDDEEEEEYNEYEEEEMKPKNQNIFEIVEKDVKELNKQRKHRLDMIHNHPSMKHPLIRNYNKIVKDSLKLEIGYCITLSGDEYVVILKTFWIKIIIRAFKKAFKKKLWSMYSSQWKGTKGNPRNISLLKGLLKK